MRNIRLIVSPEIAFDEGNLKSFIAKKEGIDQSHITGLHIINRSVDARQREIKVNVNVDFFIDEPAKPRVVTEFHYRNVSQGKRVLIVGSGPAGLFAALKLIESGLKPVIIERGKEVSERKKDIATISREQKVDPDSNYCFGEGGAGTFSDGKLYTRSSKRGNVQRVFELFHHFGADENVLYEAHPHIGTDKLPEVIKNIRKTILDCGGEIHFNTRLTDFIIDSGQITGVETGNGKINGDAVILATGHSARDVYELLQKKNIAVQAKDFAVGLRIEHPQSLIDSIQYHTKIKNQFLPAASYSLVEQVEGRGVYSFCMCPGGFVVPSATANDEIVVNGMSASKRNSPFANSAIVAEVKAADLNAYEKYGELKGLVFQQELERKASHMSSAGQKAPAQRVTDFLNNKTSSTLPDVSYFPGVVCSSLHELLPSFVRNTLQKGLRVFDAKKKGFVTSDAVLMGVETRTSSPVRILRDPLTMQHVQIKGLFPCGEGSGYAGGIASSAMDGENAAEKVNEFLISNSQNR